MTPKEKAINILNWLDQSTTKTERLIRARNLVEIYIKHENDKEAKEYWKQVKIELELV